MLFSTLTAGIYSPPSRWQMKIKSGVCKGSSEANCYPSNTSLSIKHLLNPISCDWRNTCYPQTSKSLWQEDVQSQPSSPWMREQQLSQQLWVQQEIEPELQTNHSALVDLNFLWNLSLGHKWAPPERLALCSKTQHSLKNHNRLRNLIQIISIILYTF